MLTDLRDEARLLQDAQPGHRFVERHRRHKEAGVALRIASFVLGIAVFAAGIVMLAFPGPGWVAIFFGAGLLSGESERASKLLDRLEVRARRAGRSIKRWWKGLKHPRLVGLALVVATAAAVAGLCWAAWELFGIGLPFVDVLPPPD